MGAHRRTHDAGNTVGAGRLDPERTAPRFGLGGELTHVAGTGNHGVAQPNAEVLGVGDCRLAETEQGAYLGPLPLERAVVGGGQQRRPAARRRHAEPVRQVRDSILVHLGRVVLVVTRLDRLARSTSELLRIAERVTEKNAGLQSLDEPWADTISPSGRMIMTVFAGIAEFERTLILSRTQEGRLAAQARGVAFGRPKKMLPDQQELARELARDGKSISAVARTFNVHPATIYRVLEK